MASTAQMIEWVIMNADGWDRTGQRAVLPVLNQVHRILLQNETFQSMKFDSVFGDFPFIPTIAGVFEYDLPPDVWRASELLLPFPLSMDYGFLSLFADYGFINHVRQIDTKEYFHKKYVKLPNITTIYKT